MSSETRNAQLKLQELEAVIRMHRGLSSMFVSPAGAEYDIELKLADGFTETRTLSERTVVILSTRPVREGGLGREEGAAVAALRYVHDNGGSCRILRERPSW